MLERGHGYFPALKFSVERSDEQALASVAAAEFFDNLGYSAGSRRSPRVTGVLVEEAVRYENNAPTACIPKLVEQHPR